MRERVACARCGYHKDRAAYDGRCFLCAYAVFRSVPPEPGDATYPAYVTYPIPPA